MRVKGSNSPRLVVLLIITMLVLVPAAIAPPEIPAVNTGDSVVGDAPETVAGPSAIDGADTATQIKYGKIQIKWDHNDPQGWEYKLRHPEQNHFKTYKGQKYCKINANEEDRGWGNDANKDFYAQPGTVLGHGSKYEPLTFLQLGVGRFQDGEFQSYINGQWRFHAGEVGSNLAAGGAAAAAYVYYYGALAGGPVTTVIAAAFLVAGAFGFGTDGDGPEHIMNSILGTAAEGGDGNKCGNNCPLSKFVGGQPTLTPKHDVLCHDGYWYACSAEENDGRGLTFGTDDTEAAYFCEGQRNRWLIEDCANEADENRNDRFNCLDPICFGTKQFGPVQRDIASQLPDGTVGVWRGQCQKIEAEFYCADGYDNDHDADNQVAKVRVSNDPDRLQELGGLDCNSKACRFASPYCEADNIINNPTDPILESFPFAQLYPKDVCERGPLPTDSRGEPIDYPLLDTTAVNGNLFAYNDGDYDESIRSNPCCGDDVGRPIPAEALTGTDAAIANQYVVIEIDQNLACCQVRGNFYGGRGASSLSSLPRFYKEEFVLDTSDDGDDEDRPDEFNVDLDLEVTSYIYCTPDDPSSFADMSAYGEMPFSSWPSCCHTINTYKGFSESEMEDCEVELAGYKTIVDNSGNPIFQQNRLSNFLGDKVFFLDAPEENCIQDATNVDLVDLDPSFGLPQLIGNLDIVSAQSNQISENNARCISSIPDCTDAVYGESCTCGDTVIRNGYCCETDDGFFSSQIPCSGEVSDPSVKDVAFVTSDKSALCSNNNISFKTGSPVSEWRWITADSTDDQEYSIITMRNTQRFSSNNPIDFISNGNEWFYCQAQSSSPTAPDLATPLSAFQTIPPPPDTRDDTDIDIPPGHFPCSGFALGTTVLPPYDPDCGLTGVTNCCKHQDRVWNTDIPAFVASCDCITSDGSPIVTGDGNGNPIQTAGEDNTRSVSKECFFNPDFDDECNSAAVDQPLPGLGGGAGTGDPDGAGTAADGAASGASGETPPGDGTGSGCWPVDAVQCPTAFHVCNGAIGAFPAHSYDANLRCCDTLNAELKGSPQLCARAPSTEIDPAVASNIMCYPGKGGQSHFAECCADGCINAKKNLPEVESQYGRVTGQVVNLFTSGSGLHTIGAFDQLQNGDIPILLDFVREYSYEQYIHLLSTGGDNYRTNFGQDLLNDAYDDVYNLQDWSAFDYLEFNFMVRLVEETASMPPGFNPYIKIFKNNNDESNILIDTNVFSTATNIFPAGNIIPNQWYHIKIDLSSIPDADLRNVRYAVMQSSPILRHYVDAVTLSVSETNRATNPARNKYCAADSKKWIDGTNPTGSTSQDLKGAYAEVCDAHLSLGWTGNHCCGTTSLPGPSTTTSKELYADSEGGCIAGRVIRPGQRVGDALKLPLHPDSPESNYHNIAYEGGTFKACGQATDSSIFSITAHATDLGATSGTTSTFDGSNMVSSFTVPEAQRCEVIGRHYCSFDNYFTNTPTAFTDILFTDGIFDPQVQIASRGLPDASKDPAFSSTLLSIPCNSADSSCTFGTRLSERLTVPTDMSLAISVQTSQPTYTISVQFYRSGALQGTLILSDSAPIAPIQLSPGTYEIQLNSDVEFALDRFTVGVEYPNRCCKVNQCWNGLVCADAAQYQNNSQEPALGKRPKESGFRCIEDEASNADWVYQAVKPNWDESDSGFCNSDAECYVGTLTEGDSETLKTYQCIASGEFTDGTRTNTGEFLCENGNWSTRTHGVAQKMVDIFVNSDNVLIDGVTDFTLLCDTPQRALAKVTTAETSPDLQPDALNNVCVLEKPQSREIIIGLTLNQMSVEDFITNHIQEFDAFWQTFVKPPRPGACNHVGSASLELCERAVALPHETDPTPLLDVAYIEMAYDQRTKMLFFGRVDRDDTKTVEYEKWNDWYNRYLVSPPIEPPSLVERIVSWIRGLFISNEPEVLATSVTLSDYLFETNPGYYERLFFTQSKDASADPPAQKSLVGVARHVANGAIQKAQTSFIFQGFSDADLVTIQQNFFDTEGVSTRSNLPSEVSSQQVLISQNFDHSVESGPSPIDKTWDNIVQIDLSPPSILAPPTEG